MKQFFAPMLVALLQQLNWLLCPYFLRVKLPIFLRLSGQEAPQLLTSGLIGGFRQSHFFTFKKMMRQRLNQEKPP